MTSVLDNIVSLVSLPHLSCLHQVGLSRHKTWLPDDSGVDPTTQYEVCIDVNMADSLLLTEETDLAAFPSLEESLTSPSSTSSEFFSLLLLPSS